MKTIKLKACAMDRLNNIAEKREKLADLLKNKDNRVVLHNWLKTELAYTSNAIEGNTLTREETTLVIEEGVTSGSKPLKHYQEARNHAAAYDFVLETAKARTPATESTVLALHKIILSGIDDTNAGFYRAVKVRISGSAVILPNPVKVPDLMAAFDAWLKNDATAEPLKAIEAHYRLVSIHPFVDGNGRTARLLMNLMLLESGYSPIIIRPRDRKRYLSALEKYQTTENGDAYKTFMLESLSRSLSAAIDLLDTSKPDASGQKLMKIGDFAKLCGVPASSVRYWVKVGKLSPAARTDSDYALFSENQIADVQALNKGKNK